MNENDPSRNDDLTESSQDEVAEEEPSSDVRPKEIGGPKGPEPTRYGDWEKGGRCIDF